jgi:hypothetical protein
MLGYLVLYVVLLRLYLGSFTELYGRYGFLYITFFKSSFFDVLSSFTVLVYSSFGFDFSLFLDYDFALLELSYFSLSLVFASSFICLLRLS